MTRDTRVRIVENLCPVPHDAQQAHHAASYHWLLEICPRTAIPPGFELGSGLFVNTISPEDAAQRLREAAIDPGGLREAILRHFPDRAACHLRRVAR